MAKFTEIILPLVVLLIFKINLCSCLYACPAPSICVERYNCPEYNVTYDVLDANKYPENYMCGALEETNNYVCCTHPNEIPESFVPDPVRYYYSPSITDSDYNQNANIIPYPGLEIAKPTYTTTTPVPKQCPLTSVCVRPNLCPQYGITYSSDISKEYTCGQTSETVGNICCSIKYLGEGLKQTNDDSFTIYSDSLNEINIDNYGTVNLIQYTSSATSGQETMRELEIYTVDSTDTTYEEPWACGVTLESAIRNARIYKPSGDGSVEEGSYPWHVAILTKDYKFLCSGTIVKENIVVTVAHCVDEYKEKNTEILVRVGDTNLGVDTELYPAYDVKISQLIIHPGFNIVSLESNIAVIVLENSLRGLKNVRPACLPDGTYTPAINHCRVPGFGQFTRSREDSDQFSSQLRAASFFIIDKSNCQNSLRKVPKLGSFFKLQKSVICAKGYSNAETCKGDGGGGLVCKANDLYVLKGLVSYGFGCGYGLPGVYTDIEKFLDFINDYQKYTRPYQEIPPTYQQSQDGSYVPNQPSYNPQTVPDFGFSGIHPSRDPNYRGPTYDPAKQYGQGSVTYVPPQYGQPSVPQPETYGQYQNLIPGILEFVEFPGQTIPEQIYQDGNDFSPNYQGPKLFQQFYDATYQPVPDYNQPPRYEEHLDYNPVPPYNQPPPPPPYVDPVPPYNQPPPQPPYVDPVPPYNQPPPPYFDPVPPYNQPPPPYFDPVPPYNQPPPPPPPYVDPVAPYNQPPLPYVDPLTYQSPKDQYGKHY